MTTVVLGPDLNGSALVVKTAHERKLSPNSSKYRAPYRKNPRKNISRHIVIKQIKIKYQKVLKATMEKQQITFKGLSTKLTEMETVSETVVN